MLHSMLGRNMRLADGRNYSKRKLGIARLLTREPDIYLRVNQFRRIETASLRASRPRAKESVSNRRTS
jgi:hypothetical protein